MLWVDVSADFQGMSEGEMTKLGSELIVVGYACSMVLKQGQKFDRNRFGSSDDCGRRGRGDRVSDRECPVPLVTYDPDS